MPRLVPAAFVFSGSESSAVCIATRIHCERDRPARLAARFASARILGVSWSTELVDMGLS